MKKVYQKPVVEFIKFDNVDIITCSGGGYIPPEEPGCGGGNHGNTGHGKIPFWPWPWFWKP